VGVGAAGAVVALGAEVAAGAVVAAGAAVGRGVAVAEDPQAAKKKSPKIKDVNTMKLGLLNRRNMNSVPPDFDTARILAVHQS